MTKQTRLRAGAARVETTPSSLEGLNPFGPDFLSVRDPLYARALVVDDGDQQAALIALDLVEVGVTDDIRARIAAETGIPADRVMLAPCHSHNCPRVGLVTPGGKARIPTPQSLIYTQYVYDRIIEAIRAAQANLRPAWLGFGAEAVDVNVCREAYVNDVWTLGYVPDGISDKTLSVLSLVDEAGEVIAAVLNYAVHPTVMLGVREVSADLAGETVANVENALGDGAVVLWTSAALGDQAPKVQLGEATNNPDRDRAFATSALRAQGFMLGAAAARIISVTDGFSGTGPVRAGLTVIPCPVRRLPVPPGMEQAEVDTVDLTLATLQIGPVVFAGVSGEVTVPVGRAIKQASPLAQTLIISNANARIGYLPTDESYDRKTHAANGCPIVKGHAAKTIVCGLADLVMAGLTAHG